jgi:hypothetical protein
MIAGIPIELQSADAWLCDTFFRSSYYVERQESGAGVLTHSRTESRVEVNCRFCVNLCHAVIAWCLDRLYARISLRVLMIPEAEQVERHQHN